MSKHAAADYQAAPLGGRRSPAAAMAAHLRVPLFRDGYALVLNSGLTAVLGLAYWLIAAREYSPRVVGVNTAAISAMMFLAGVAQFNLMSALVRFVPILRGARGRFIAGTYLVTAVAAVVCSAVFLLGVSHWAPALGVLGSTPGMVVWFVAATVAWGVFNLQDSALTGLGAAVLVPVENFVYGLAKIVLLIALVSVSPRFGIFGSWTAALLVSMLPVNLWIFGRLLRRSRVGRNAAVAAPTRNEIIRFAAPDYLAALMWLAATALMPVIIVAIAGATANAYFSLAWMIVLPIVAASASMGVALVATAAPEPERLPEYARAVMRRTVRLTVPVALALALAAPVVLRVFGRHYADHASVTLALLALMTIPNTITALYTSIYRAQRRMRAVVILQTSLSGAVLIVAPLMLSAMGVAGVALAWLVCQTIVATVLLVLDREVVRPGGRTLLDLAADLGTVSLARRLRAHRFASRNRADLARCIPSGMVLTKVESTVNDVVVGRAVGRDECDSVFVKRARTAAGDESLRNAGDRLAALAADPRLSGWNVQRPRILAVDSLDGHRFVVESALSGVPIAALLARGASLEPLAQRAAAAIDGLHSRTMAPVTADSELLERWIHTPARAIEPISARSRGRSSALRVLGNELGDRLEGRTLNVSWIHGDFVPGNVLMDHTGEQVTGIIDWELATDRDLPALDLTMFMLAAHTQIVHRELGQLVAAVITGQASESLERSLARVAQIDELDAPTLTLLCWLRHVAALLTKSERYAHHALWKHYNVFQVLDAVGRRRGAVTHPLVLRDT